MYYTLFVFGAGVAVGTIFSNLIKKWGSKAKAAAQEVAADVKQEIDKNKTH